jgi:hypothetical protein
VVTTTRASAGRLRVTVAAGRGSIRAIQFKAGTNARVDVGTLTNQALPINWTLPTPAPQMTLLVHRATAGQATTVPLVVTDDCGDWSTFVGGGPSAF